MADFVSKTISAAIRELFVDVEVDGLTVFLLLEALGHIGVVLV